MATPAQKKLVQKRLTDIRKAVNVRFKWPKWTGFSSKTLWDWLNLMAALAIPIVVLSATLNFNIQQDKANQDNRQNDLKIADDQQQEATLKAYLDDMTTLLLDKKLGSQAAADKATSAEAAVVARERTLTTLRRLHADRNRIVLQFLRDAHLIGPQDAVINLSNANLSNDDLSGGDLSHTDLSHTDLSRATLNGTDLNGATLNGATLDGTDLNGAHLNGATLYDSHLNGAHLNGATLYDSHLNGATLYDSHLNGATLYDSHLNGATLIDTDLSGASLYGAFLYGASLYGAILNGADLSGVHLSGVRLSGANVSDANLSDADVSYADLIDVDNLTQQQLDTVYSCTNAILPTGLICHRHSSMVTLTYWYTESPTERPVVLHLIQQFQQQNPNIKINAVYKPLAQTAFITAAQAGNAPDVLRSDIGWVTQFASQGYLLNLDPFVSQLDLSDYLPVPLSYDEYNGGLYGLPQMTDYLALLYNRAELANVGITSPRALATMADFEAAAMKIVQSEAAPYGFETTGTAYYVLPFLWAFGGGMIDQHNNILVNSSGSVNGLTFLLNLQNRDKVMPAKVDFSTGSTNMVNDFKSGKTAMIFDGPWDVSNILTGSAFAGNPSNLGIAAIPKGPTEQTGSPVGGQSYVISADTAHPAEAYKFISFMSSTASQVAIAEANHMLPTHQSAYKDPGVSSDPVILEFYTIQYTAIARSAIPQGGYLFDAFDPNIGAALDGAKSPSDALNAVADAWKQLLAGS
jgi:arabinogalactan oligomer / maltooligosaccharide transport system substrate-binding protein